MPPSHLHSYPKTFNSWGHLKAFPLRSPVKYNFLYLGFCAMGVFLLVELMTSAVFETFNNSDFLSGDKTRLLLRKRAFDTLILANKMVADGESVRNRSIF